MQKTVIQRLQKVERDLLQLRKRSVDNDSIATPADLRAIEQAHRELAEGKTIPWEQVKRELQERGVRVGRRVE